MHEIPFNVRFGLRASTTTILYQWIRAPLAFLVYQLWSSLWGIFLGRGRGPMGRSLGREMKDRYEQGTRYIDDNIIMNLIFLCSCMLIKCWKITENKCLQSFQYLFFQYLFPICNYAEYSWDLFFVTFISSYHVAVVV